MKAKHGFGREAAHAAARGGAGMYARRAPAKKKSKGRPWCRYPAQRDALAKLGWTASNLRDWLSCEYLRARGLRGGNLGLTATDLAILQEHSPVGGHQLAKAIALSAGDVRLAQLGLKLDGGDA